MFNKKRIALLLAVTMILGSTVTVFADNGNVPGGGSATGTGSKEGHLDREIGNVVLPTTVSSNAFSYTIDPERLVAETSAAKYSGATWGTTAQADGVFFQTGANTYDSKTGEYEVVNKSTFPINVTVKVAAPATAAETDIPLVSENALSSATQASLYLGLKMGATPATAEAVPVLTGEPAETTLSVNAVTTNFEAKYVSGNYVYQEKAGVADNTWARTKFLVEGKTTNGANGAEGLQITDDTTAPALTVTWKWAKYGAPTSYVSDTTISGTNNVLTLTLPEGVTVSSVKCKSATTDYAVLPTARYTVANGKITFVKETVNAFSGGNFKIVYSDGHEDELTIQ